MWAFFAPLSLFLREESTWKEESAEVISIEMDNDGWMYLIRTQRRCTLAVRANRTMWRQIPFIPVLLLGLSLWNGGRERKKCRPLHAKTQLISRNVWNDELPFPAVLMYFRH